MQPHTTFLTDVSAVGVSERENLLLLIPEPEAQHISILLLMFQWIPLPKWKRGSPASWLPRYNEQKSYESGMHTLGLPQWPPLCSCPPEQGDVWAKLHPYRDDHVVLPSPLPTNSHMTSDPSFPPAVLFVISFWVWVSVRRTSPLVLPRGQTFLSFMQAKFSCCIHELRQTGKPYEEGPGWFLSH